ncbi:MAG TPA: dNTP triphosphohydrolase [Bryobacteraceae bacterium]|nr:dNTP triphosphohydrolase [Bryobacteraceae bacterium]
MNTRALAHLRFPVDRSRGRRYPEIPHRYRNDFSRDRDRIVHTRAFRRLEDKTQVFTPGLHDHFRNRLTHTLEVAQISRTVASVLGLDEDLTEALALAHDIGHPPFAHSGEQELDRQMRVFGECFEHNLHSLRIVEVLEQRYARFPGLNLSFEVREGIAKHSRDFEPGDFPELEEYLPGLRPPLEAQLIDLADEIAYNTADLDDAFSARMFTTEQLAAEVPGYAQLLETVETQFAGAPEHVRFLESVRAVIDFLATGLIQGTAWAAEAAGVSSMDDVREHPERLARMTPEPEQTNAALKRFLRAHVYYSPTLVAEREQAARNVSALFQHLLQHPDLLPEEDRSDAVPLHRLICDYIAGMTDSRFIRVFTGLSRS